MKHLKKTLILFGILLTSLLVFTNKLFAESEEYITFNYYEQLDDLNLVNLHVSNMPNEQTFKKGITFTHIAKPKSTNYTFNYWVYYIDEVEYVLKVGDQFFDDTDFYAVWTPTLRGIYYNLDGGTNHPNNPNFFYGFQTVMLEEPIKEDYEFLGFYNNSSFEGSVIESLGDGDKTTTLYAKWKKLPTIADLKIDLNDEFYFNINIDELNDINVLFNNLFKTDDVSTVLKDVIEVIINNIDSGTITINNNDFMLETSNKEDIVLELLNGVNVQEFLDDADSLNVLYELNVLYKGRNLLFEGSFNLEVDVINEVDVDTLEELLFVLERPKVQSINIIEDITLIEDVVISREVNIKVINSDLNLGGKDISFVQTDEEAYYEIEGVFKDGTITINNSNGHFELKGLINTNATINVVASASNTVNIIGFWGVLNVNDVSGGKTVVKASVGDVNVESESNVEVLESTITNLIVKGSSAVVVGNEVAIEKLNISEEATVLIEDEEEVLVVEIENENNGLYYEELKTYTIKFEYDNDYTEVLVNSGNKVEELIVSKLGYTFVSWNLNDSLFDFSLGIKFDYTLVAVFIINDFNIYLNGYDGPVTYPEEITISASHDSVVGSATYKWFKDSLLVNETDQIILTEVDQSGIYNVFVTITDGLYTHTLSKQIEIVILPEEVIVSPTGTKTKTYGSDEPNYSFNLSKDIDVLGTISREEGEDAGVYLFSVDELVPISNNYQLVIDESIIFTITKGVGTLTTNFADVRGYKVVEIDYTDNSLITFTNNDLEEGLLNVFVGTINENSKVNFSFDDIDLSEGASTFIVEVVVTGNNIHPITNSVAFKFKSVIIQGNSTLYTVEDALNTARRANNVVILYNTSFAESDVAVRLYNNAKYRTIKQNVYMILPEGGPDENGKYTENIDKAEHLKVSGAQKIDRNNYVVRLNVPENITVIAYDRLIVNAKRGSASTLYNGFVAGSSYSILNLSEGSKLILNSGGKLMVAGFVTGEGSVEARNGSFVEDVMFVESWRGGSDTTNIFEHAFPFYQFSVANIEVDLIIHHGAKYDVDVFLYVSGGFASAKLIVVDKAQEGSKALIQLESGVIIKKYNITNGETTIELHEGAASVNETSLRAGAFNITSEGIDMSFNGRWKFVVKEDSEFTVNSYMLLFPGSSITVEENATLIVNEGSRLTIFNPYEFIEDDRIYNDYPNNQVDKYFRTEITYSYDAYSKANLNLDGTLIVNSGAQIAGVINEGPNSTINIAEGAITEYKIQYVLGSSPARIVERVVRLWDDEDYYISVTTDLINYRPLSDGEVRDEEEPFESEIKTYIIDKYGNRVEGTANYIIEIQDVERDEEGNIIGMSPSGIVYQSGVIDIVNGIGTFLFTTNENNIYEVKVIYDGVTSYVMLYVGEESSPFLYSEDEDGNLHFEHEPFGYSMIKAIKDTTYGTLRLIQDQDGIYYIQIVEEGNSTTALNNIELYAIDYLANQDVIDAMFDINGNPHTIKERISPKEFIDSLGRDQLAQVLTKDGTYATNDNNGSLFNYFIASFDKPLNQNHAKLLVTPRGTAGGVEFVAPFLDPINYQDNLWWLDEALSHESVNATIKNVFDIFEMLIQVWDGNDWVTQVSIQPKTYFDEELLVYLDLSNITTTDLKVRLLYPTMMNYKINNISVDYSTNVDMIINKLDLVSATLNNEVDILDSVSNLDNNYIYLDYKDSARLGFASPSLLEGYERFIGVNATGYIYTSDTTIKHELKEEIEGKSFAEIVDIINNSNDEKLINYVDQVTELYYLLLQLGSLEYEEIVYVLFDLLNQS